MGVTDRIQAKAKQAAGGLLGNEQLRREGVEEERAAGQRRASATEGSIPQMTIDPVGRGQSESPLENTVHNLVHTLSVKLDSAHRYGLYQEDAVREGHEDCAQVFADIAEQEREMIGLLVGLLQDRLGGASMTAGAAAAGGVAGGLGHEAVPGAGAQGVPPLPGDVEPGPSPEPVEPGIETVVPGEPGIATDVPGEPGTETDVPVEPGIETDVPGEPGIETDVPPTAPGGPGAEPGGTDTPRTL